MSTPIGARPAPAPVRPVAPPAPAPAAGAAAAPVRRATVGDPKPAAAVDAGRGAAQLSLRRGSAGEPVSTLQAKLNGAGAGLAVDGLFGPKTEAAVKGFQASRGLEADGIVGPKTREAIASGAPATAPAPAPGPAAPAPPAAPATDAAAKNVSTKGLTPNSMTVLGQANDPKYGLHLISGVASRGNVSDHPGGKAVDVSNGTLTPQMRSFADDIRGKPGVKYVIYDNQIASADSGWAWKPYTHPSGGNNPTLNHEDHVHVSVT